MDLRLIGDGSEDRNRRWYLVTYLFWSSWRRQTKKDGWNLQDCGVLSDGEYFSLHRRHTLAAAVTAQFLSFFRF
jgi:hypothetical protein